MFDLSELERWDEALASLSHTTPVQTPEQVVQSSHAASRVESSETAAVCPFGYGLHEQGRTTHER